MKLGVSTYSLSRAIMAGELTAPDAMFAIAELGGEHAEIVPIGFDLHAEPGLAAAIRRSAADAGIALSGYAVGANFSGLDDDALEAEIRRVQREVDMAHELGVTRMRHDVASSADTSIGHFLAELPRLAEACRIVADYAKPLGIVTSVENHGYYMQASDRVKALVEAVGRDNFRTTLDVGNFLCVDEDPEAAVRNNIALASMVHVKDFYRRPGGRDMGEGWFRSAAGRMLRGAIAGQGDVDLPAVLRAVADAGYDGYLSLEFEGMEDCRTGVRLGLAAVRQMLAELTEGGERE